MLSGLVLFFFGGALDDGYNDLSRIIFVCQRTEGGSEGDLYVLVRVIALCWGCEVCVGGFPLGGHQLMLGVSSEIELVAFTTQATKIGRAHV